MDSAGGHGQVQNLHVLGLHRETLVRPISVHHGSLIVTVESKDLDPIARGILESVSDEMNVRSVFRPAVGGVLLILRLRFFLPLGGELVRQPRRDQKRHGRADRFEFSLNVARRP